MMTAGIIGEQIEGVEIEGVEIEGVEIEEVEIEGVEIEGVEIEGVDIEETTAPLPSPYPRPPSAILKSLRVSRSKKLLTS